MERRKKRKLKGRVKKKKVMTNITVEEMKENVTNILAGVKAQNGFRRAYLEAVVRRRVSDVNVANELVKELNTKFDDVETKFEEAAKAEAEEVDLEPADAENLVKDLFV